MTIARDENNQGSDILFCILIFIFSFLLYGNTLSGGAGYVWDDRAAILSNGDVSSANPLIDLFYHDFWGQDIRLADSHKSYRPATVLTFRFNHWLHGYSPFGFHALNIFIYAVGVVVYYNWARQWSKQSVSRVAALLYCSHPIHVEAVASLVGRADSLCGLFYLTAIYLYTCGSRRKWYSSTSELSSSMISSGTTVETVATEAAIAKKGSGATTTSTRRAASSISNATNLIEMSTPMKSPSSSSSSSSRFRFNVSTALYFLASFFAALLASFSKEVGITVFLIFICLEILDLISQTIRRIEESKKIISLNMEFGKNTSIRKGSNKENFFGLSSKDFNYSVQLIYNMRPEIQSLLRLFSSILIIFLLLYHRYKMNNGTLYKWTVLENHISLLPSFKMRVLSYAQSHFWYFFKLIYPRYLCFDYGFSCLPIISLFLDSRNILPLITYSSYLLFLLYSIIKMKYNIILYLLLIIVPLLPALNILFPIGTILAERLLFIPSAGYCLLLSEILIGVLNFDFLSIFFKIKNLLFYQFLSNITHLFIQFKILAILQLQKFYFPIFTIMKFKVEDKISMKTNVSSTTKSEEVDFMVLNNKIKKNEKIKKIVRFCEGKKSKKNDYKCPEASKNSENLTVPVTNKIEKNVILTEEKNIFMFQKYFISYQKLFFPMVLFLLFCYRVVTRTSDWNSEIQLYRSALNVCPLSVKVSVYVCVRAIDNII